MTMAVLPVVDYALNLIHNQATIGLGGGQTVAQLACQLAEAHFSGNVTTCSPTTQQLLEQLSLNVVPLADLKQVTITFDGCDEVTPEFWALKSRGGIHVDEKLLAHLSQHYIVFANDQKFHAHFTGETPLCLEVLPAAKTYVSQYLSTLSLQGQYRVDQGGHFFRTTRQTLLLDVGCPSSFLTTQQLTAIDQLYGVVGNSLFKNELTGILYDHHHQVDFLKKGEI